MKISKNILMITGIVVLTSGYNTFSEQSAEKQ